MLCYVMLCYVDQLGKAHETKESQGHGNPDHKRVVFRGMWDGKKAEKQFKVVDCNW